MTQEELKNAVDSIIAESSDYEIAHSEEDELHVKLINTFCPEWVKSEIARLQDADFPRHCA